MLVPRNSPHRKKSRDCWYRRHLKETHVPAGHELNTRWSKRARLEVPGAVALLSPWAAHFPRLSSYPQGVENTLHSPVDKRAQWLGERGPEPSGLGSHPDCPFPARVMLASVPALDAGAESSVCPVGDTSALQGKHVEVGLAHRSLVQVLVQVHWAPGTRRQRDDHWPWRHLCPSPQGFYHHQHPPAISSLPSFLQTQAASDGFPRPPAPRS